MGNNPKLSRGRTVAILGIIILLLTLTALTGRERLRLTFLEAIVLTVFSPVQTFVSTTSGRVADLFESIRNYQQVEAENRYLREALFQQELIAIQLKELRQENYRLRELLEFKAQTTYELLPAEVIARNPSHWFEMLTVDKGSRHGVRQGMPVVTNQGLVGSIFTVTPNSSQVLLLTDPRRGVSALVQRSRDAGVVSPGTVEGSADHQGYLVMRNLTPEANIQVGDTIISSGLGPLFPKGLVLGYVLEVGDDEYGLLRYALLDPAVNFNRLEELFIVMETDLPKEDEPTDMDGEEVDG